MRELTAELVVDGLMPDGVQISPDGRWVAYGVTPASRADEHPVGAIWLAATDGTTLPRQLTAGTVKDGAPRWSGDGRWLFFLSDRAERGKAQLHRIALDGGEAEALTEWKPGIDGFAPLPDGQTVAFWAKDIPSEDDERREKERDDAVVWGERLPYVRLRLLDLASRQVRTVDGLGDRHVTEAAPRPDDGTLAVATWPIPLGDPGSLDTQIHIVDPKDGTVRRLAQAEPETEGLTWRRAADGWHLLHLAATPPIYTAGNALFDLPVPETWEKEPEGRNLTAGLAACPAGLVAVTAGEPLAVIFEGLDTELYRIDAATAALVKVGHFQGPLGYVSASADGQTVAAGRSTPSEEGNVWAGPPSGPLRRLSELRPEYREIAWGAQERLAWTAPDGLAIDGILILPPGKTRADGPFPLITLPHGGPYGRYADGFQLGWPPSGQWLATAGYAVFLPNPRGGMGHGSEFARVVAGAVGMEDWIDIQTGIDKLIAEGVADPDRLGIGGWSQGGFMTAWAVGQTERFKAGVMGAGVSDWGMMVAGSDMPHFEAELGGSTGWEGPGPHRHDALSPISFAARAKTPVLILHGERDERVPVHQGQFFFRALKEHNVPTEYVVYPREPHGLRERNHQLDCLRRTRAWFDRWIGAAGRRDGEAAGSDSA